VIDINASFPTQATQWAVDLRAASNDAVARGDEYAVRLTPLMARQLARLLDSLREAWAE
jgi:hypothetical protein